MDVRRILGFMRMAVGIFSWSSPSASARAFGLGDVARDPRAAMLGRLFGVRDLVLGASVAFARDDAALGNALRLGVVVDTVDVAASAIGRRRGLGRGATALIGGGAFALALMGVESLRRLGRARPSAA